MPWPFELQFMQLALVSGLVVGATAPLIGTFLVQRRMSLMGDGVGHVAFAGVAAGFLAGVWPVWTALALAVVAAVVVDRLRSRGTAQGDLALAMIFYGGIAGGVVLIGLAGSLDVNLFAYLFGSILTVGPSEVWVALALGAVIVATVAACGRALFAMAVDEEWARVAGVPVGALNTVLSVLVAVTVVAAMRVVGILLVAALMVVPVATAQLIARSQRGILGWSAVVGMISVVAGLVAARTWGLAPGGTIVLFAIGIFGVTTTVGSLRRLQVRPSAARSPRAAASAPVLSDSHPHW
jgi:zinc transport system permease protein